MSAAYWSICSNITSNISSNLCAINFWVICFDKMYIFSSIFFFPPTRFASLNLICIPSPFSAALLPFLWERIYQLPSSLQILYPWSLFDGNPLSLILQNDMCWLWLVCFWQCCVVSACCCFSFWLAIGEPLHTPQVKVCHFNNLKDLQYFISLYLFYWSDPNLKRFVRLGSFSVI